MNSLLILAGACGMAVAVAVGGSAIVRGCEIFRAGQKAMRKKKSTEKLKDVTGIFCKPPIGFF